MAPELGINFLVFLARVEQSSTDDDFFECYQWVFLDSKFGWYVVTTTSDHSKRAVDGSEAVATTNQQKVLLRVCS